MRKMTALLLIYLALAPMGVCQQLYLSEEHTSSFPAANTKSQDLTPSSFDLFVPLQEQEINSSKWQELLAELDAKAEKNPDSLSFVRSIFQKAHQKLFKDYSMHSTFTEMLQTGAYDCVSGSAALGMLLDRYGYAFDEVETDYHVFLQVYLDGKTLILESTLPVGGMITSTSEVNNYLGAYLSEGVPGARNINEGLAGTKVDVSDNSIFRKVNLTELAGLQYYNEGIVFFNQQDYKQAIDQLSKAYALYPSERIDGLRELSRELAYHSYGLDIRK